MKIRLSAAAAASTGLVLVLGACSAGETTASGDAGSGAWEPSETVTLLVPYGAGGGTDAVFRQLAQIINDEGLSGTRWIVENREGGSGTTGMREVAGQEGEEHLLLATTPGHISVPISQDMDISVQDLTPVANTLIDPQVLYTVQGSGYESVDAIIEALTDEAKSVSFGGGPAAQDDHLTTLLFERETDTSVNYIPFDGGGDLKTAVLGGQVDVGWLNPSEAAGQTVAEGGDLVPVAVALEEPLEELPDVPTFADAGYDVVYDMFFRALMAPPGVSDEVTAYYGDVVEQATETQAWQDFLEQNKVSSNFLGPDEFASALDDWSSEVQGLLEDGA
jgi:putative tricarboxylic transport membrane protein